MFEVELEERVCKNPKCQAPFKVNKGDDKNFYHGLACRAEHTKKPVDWEGMLHKLALLPKEIRDHTRSTPIPKIY